MIVGKVHSRQSPGSSAGDFHLSRIQGSQEEDVVPPPPSGARGAKNALEGVVMDGEHE